MQLRFDFYAGGFAHPLRTIRLLVNETLAAMERDFAALYAGIGRPSKTADRVAQFAEETAEGRYGIKSIGLTLRLIEMLTTADGPKGASVLGACGRLFCPVTNRRPSSASRQPAPARCARRDGDAHRSVVRLRESAAARTARPIRNERGHACL